MAEKEDNTLKSETSKMLHLKSAEDLFKDYVNLQQWDKAIKRDEDTRKIIGKFDTIEDKFFSKHNGSDDDGKANHYMLTGGSAEKHRKAVDFLNTQILEHVKRTDPNMYESLKNNEEMIQVYLDGNTQQGHYHETIKELAKHEGSIKELMKRQDSKYNLTKQILATNENKDERKLKYLESHIKNMQYESDTIKDLFKSHTGKELTVDASIADTLRHVTEYEKEGKKKFAEEYLADNAYHFKGEKGKTKVLEPLYKDKAA